MINLRMAEKLKQEKCIDVLTIGKEIESGLYELNDFEEDVDYCDAKKELWIWSIGKRYSDNKIYAATDGRFYQNKNYECLWLR